ncbi:MAG: polysaccharide biosynthesis tyrosine autokinase [Verrucomicrobiaceae bacterium]|nr:polysaccharide biosynthesis tyrosine autokinase [Verrucomicrobiaceae bacterium]
MSQPPGSGSSSTLSRIHETSAKLQRYKILLRRRWWFLLLTTSIGLCVMVLRITGQEKTYTSLAKLVAGGRVVGSNSGAQYLDYLQDFYGTIIETIESSELRRRALERVSAHNPDVAEVEVDIRVVQNRGSAIFNVSAEGAEPKYTKLFLDALLDEFMLFRENERDSKKNKALMTLNQDLKERSAAVEEMVNRLTEFKANNAIVLLSNGQNEAGAWLTRARLEKYEYERQLTEVELLLTDLNAALHQRQRIGSNPTLFPQDGAAGGSALPEAATLADVGATRSSLGRETAAGFTRTEQEYLEEQKKLSGLNRERASLLESFLEQHPKVLEVDRQIARVKGTMDDVQKEILDEAKGQKTALERKIKTLDTQIEERSKQAQDVGEKLAEHQRLSKMVEEGTKSLDQVRDLVHRFQVDQELGGDAVTIMERASPALEAPPEFIMPIALGLIVGLCVGIITLLLFDRLDDRMNSFAEFQSLFPNEAVIGQIPEQRQRGDVALLKSNDDRHLYAEAFRNVRSSVLFKNWRGKPPKSILVTSAVPNEGKTTVTSNLALTISHSGAKVLLVDCDLRRGGVNELFKLPGSPGLSEVLRGKLPWRKAVQKSQSPNLDIVARGEVFDQTSEMLLSKTAEEVLKEMSAEYDYVIFDSAPVLVADDTGSFAPKIDTVLFVVRMSSTMARLSAKALDILYDRQVNVGGVILNRSNTSLKEYTYYNYASYYYTKPDAASDSTAPAES